MDIKTIQQRHIKDADGIMTAGVDVLIRKYDDVIELQQQRDVVVIHRTKIEELIKFLGQQ